MALKIYNLPNSGAADADYPQGSVLDEQTPGNLDGTQVKADLYNDFSGFFQKLLDVASVTPSGNPDTVLASDYFDALKEVVGDLEWIATVNYTVPVIVLGSDGELYRGIQASGPGSTVVNPTTDTDESHWFKIDAVSSTTRAGRVRTATNTEATNQTAVDAYIKPDQLGTSAVVDHGTSSGEIPLNSDLGDFATADTYWGAWVSPTFGSGWAASSASDHSALKVRKSIDGDLVHISGAVTAPSATTGQPIAFELPTGYVCSQRLRGLIYDATYWETGVSNTEEFKIYGYTQSSTYTVNEILTLIGP